MVLYRLVTKRVSLHAVLTLLHGEDVSHELVDECSGPLFTRALSGSGSEAWHTVGWQLTILCTEGSYIKFISFSHF